MDDQKEIARLRQEVDQLKREMAALLKWQKDVAGAARSARVSRNFPGPSVAKL